MPGFEEDRAELNAASKQKADRLSKAITARDTVRRFEREIEIAGRRSNSSDPAMIALNQQLAAAQTELQAANQNLSASKAALDAALEQFARPVDPSVAVEQWPDAVSYTHLTLPTTSRV